MTEKTLFAIYGSAAALSCFGVLLTPWFIVVTCVCLICTLVPVLRQAKTTKELLLELAKVNAKIESLDNEYKVNKLDIKKQADDISAALNRVNMSLGVRK